MSKKYPIALQSVDIQATLRGLFAEVDVVQVYQNSEETDIEAVYTFPLPLDAVLLEVSLELNGEFRRGLVQRKSEAEDRYEEAVEGGDAAVLLEQMEPGVFALNAGNLKSGERATVRFRYGLLLKWNGDRLRFHMPATLAPRYGDPAAAGWAPQQTPEAYALSPGFGFSCRIQVEGELARADFECPSHPVKMKTRGDVREISLPGKSTLMDRDFILILNKPVDFSVHGFWAPDAESKDGGCVGLVSFCPQSKADAVAPRCVKLVVDCSGSMGGPSIEQAKSALREILSLLGPDDEFEVIAFGSDVKSCFHGMVSADRRNLVQAEKFVDDLDADMSGTETGRALDRAYRCGSRASDVFLITDGQIHAHAEAIAQAEKSGHRIFPVGVGHAVVESFLRDLAEATSGACELVSPKEGMADRIVRHFQRIDSPKVASVRIEGIDDDDWILQRPLSDEILHSRDTLHVFYWQDDPSEKSIRFEVTFEDGQVHREEISRWRRLESIRGEQLNLLPRMAIHDKLAGCDAEDAEDVDEMAQLAVDYQLVTEHTSCVLVLEREAGEKADGQPKLRKVPQTLAAGWGGLNCVVLSGIGSTARPRLPGRDAGIRRAHIRDFIAAVNALPARELEKRLEGWTIDEFARLVDYDPALMELLDWLKGVAATEAREKTVIVVFLALLSIKWSRRKLRADARKIIWDAFGKARPSPELIKKIADVTALD